MCVLVVYVSVTVSLSLSLSLSVSVCMCVCVYILQMVDEGCQWTASLTLLPALDELPTTVAAVATSMQPTAALPMDGGGGVGDVDGAENTPVLPLIKNRHLLVSLLRVCAWSVWWRVCVIVAVCHTATHTATHCNTLQHTDMDMCAVTHAYLCHDSCICVP